MPTFPLVATLAIDWPDGEAVAVRRLDWPELLSADGHGSDRMVRIGEVIDGGRGPQLPVCLDSVGVAADTISST